MAPELPDFVPPMLCKQGQAFDSDEHLFEIKWDGTRILAIRGDELVLINRRRNLKTSNYPELDVLEGLPQGTILDGEVVVLRDGKPDFEAMLQRDQARAPSRSVMHAKAMPATYVVFDLLYEGFASRMDEPLVARRERAAELVAALGSPRVVFSEGIVGPGKAYFERCADEGLEGVIAKRLDSPYQPGKRTDAWQKIKRSQRCHCLILGYLPQEDGQLRSLILASDLGGELAYVGKVGSGIGERRRQQLLEALRTRVSDAPIVACDEPGIWVEPGLFCTVTYLELTSGGHLRAPVFDELVD